MVSDSMIKAVKALAHNPDAKVHIRTRTGLTNNGLLEGGILTRAGWDLSEVPYDIANYIVLGRTLKIQNFTYAKGTTFLIRSRSSVSKRYPYGVVNCVRPFEVDGEQVHDAQDNPVFIPHTIVVSSQDYGVQTYSKKLTIDKT